MVGLKGGYKGKDLQGVRCGNLEFQGVRGGSYAENGNRISMENMRRGDFQRKPLQGVCCEEIGVMVNNTLVSAT